MGTGADVGAPTDSGLAIRCAVLSPRRVYEDRLDMNHHRLMESVRAHPSFTIFDPDETSEAEIFGALGGFDVLLNDEWAGWDRTHPAREHHPRLRIGKFRNDVQYRPEEDMDYDFHVLRYSCRTSRELIDPSSSFYLRHHYDTEVYRDRGLEKTVDVLVYGRLDEGTYPFRTRVARLLSAGLRGRVVKVLPHPGYRNDPWSKLKRLVTRRPMIRLEELSREINRAHLALATPSRFDYLLRKYGEIALSGAAILGNVPEEAEGLLGDAIVRIGPDQSDAEILETVERALSDPAELRRRAAILGERFRSRYDVAGYAEKLLRICTWVSHGTSGFDGEGVELSPDGRPIL